MDVDREEGLDKDQGTGDCLFKAFLFGVCSFLTDLLTLWLQAAFPAFFGYLHTKRLRFPITEIRVAENLEELSI